MQRVGLVLCACAVLSGVGCRGTYEVEFVNNSGTVTDIRTSQTGGSATVVLDVPAGGTADFSHDGAGRSLTVQTGAVVGQQMVVVDAECTVRVTDADTVLVTKTAAGSLECIVIPGAPIPDNDE